MVSLAPCSTSVERRRCMEKKRGPLACRSRVLGGVTDPSYPIRHGVELAWWRVSSLSIAPHLQGGQIIKKVIFVISENRSALLALSSLLTGKDGRCSRNPLESALRRRGEQAPPCFPPGTKAYCVHNTLVARHTHTHTARTADLSLEGRGRGPRMPHGNMT